MHLASATAQDVPVSNLRRAFHFEPNETIHTENSYKYTRGSIEGHAEAAGFRVSELFTDERNWFALALFSPSEFDLDRLFSHRAFFITLLPKIFSISSWVQFKQFPLLRSFMVDEQCLRALEGLRWPNGVTWLLRRRRTSPSPIYDELSALRAQRDGMVSSTREASNDKFDGPTLCGVVEVDETLVGGRRRGVGSGSRKGKTWVAGAIQRDGQVRLGRRHPQEDAPRDQTPRQGRDRAILRNDTIHNGQPLRVVGDVHTNRSSVWTSVPSRSTRSARSILTATSLEWRFNNRDNGHIFRDRSSASQHRPCDLQGNGGVISSKTFYRLPALHPFS